MAKLLNLATFDNKIFKIFQNINNINNILDIGIQIYYILYTTAITYTCTGTYIYKYKPDREPMTVSEES